MHQTSAASLVTFFFFFKIEGKTSEHLAHEQLAHD